MTANEDLLFLELCLKRELVDQSQVDEILAVQKKLSEMGLEESVCDLMVKKGILSRTDAAAVQVKVSPRGGRQQIVGYHLVDRLGRGGMGSVYKAIQVSMGRPVALKVLKPSLAKNDQRTERLRREARLVGKLRHPNIVQGLDFGVSNGFHYFAMEYVDGDSVKDLLDQRGPFREREALRIVRQVCMALDYAHKEGVVHRDVKPGNILIDRRTGAVKLADYGLAKGPLEDVELTHSGVTVGTPQYISPEQARDPSNVDIRTDVYSLGATLYHMLTGRPPFEGSTLAHLIQQVLYEPYAPPRSLRRDLSKDIAFLIDKMMARKPRHRFQSPKELLAALDTIEKGRTIIPSGWQGDFEAFHLRRKYRLLVTSLALLLVVGGGGSAFTWWQLHTMEHQQRERTAEGELDDILTRGISLQALSRRIEQLKGFVEEYAGTKAAAKAKARLVLLERQKHHVAEFNRENQNAQRLVHRGDYAKALDKLFRLRQDLSRLPKTEAGFALGQVDEAVAAIRSRRALQLPKDIEAEKQALLTVPPEKAREELETFLNELEGRSYLPSEHERSPVEAGRRLANTLDAAIRGTVTYLSGPRTLLSNASKQTDYEKIQTKLDEAKRRFEADTGLQQSLKYLPQPWQTNLEHQFPDVQQQIVDANKKAAAQVEASAAGQAKNGDYQAASDAVQSLANRSVESVAGTLNNYANELQTEQQNAEQQASKAFSGFVAAFLRMLDQHQWKAAMTLITQTRDQVDIYHPNPYTAVFAGAQHTTDLAMNIVAAFVQKMNGAPRVPGGLHFAGIEYEAYSVEITGQTIEFRDGSGNLVQKDLKDLAVSDIARLSGIQVDATMRDFTVAVLQIGEMQRTLGPREFLAALKGRIEAPVLAALNSPPLGDFAMSVRVYIGDLERRFEQSLSALEDAAKARFSSAVTDMRANDWQDAYDKLKSLLEDNDLKNTEYVKGLRTTIESMMEEAKKHLPSARLERYYHARVTYLCGGPPQTGKYQASLRFDMEHPGELSRASFDSTRVAVEKVAESVYGPPPPGVDGEKWSRRTGHLLEFLAPEHLPEDWLDRHPLRIQSPFLYFREMSIELRVRWTRPVAFVLSLAGTNVVVLTDDGRKEDGRGVYIWQSENLDHLDREVPAHYRKVWLDRHPDALEGRARSKKYFEFQPERWYRVRFVKGEKEARLYVGGRLVFEQPIRQYRFKGKEITVLTYSPCEMDDIRITGTVDPEFYRHH